MLTYQIKNLIAPHSNTFVLIGPPKKEEVADIYLSRKAIMDRQISNSIFKVGDHVKFKKPKRNPIYGVIQHIEDNPNKCEWKMTSPQNIAVSVPLVDPHSNIEYGSQIINTNMRRILYIRKADV